MNTLNAEVKAAVQITPEKSHIYLFMLVLGALISLLAGFLFLWNKPELCWVPFVFALVFLMAGGFVWLKSHVNIDMAGASPTVISNSNTGVQITTDTRALNSPEIVRSLSQIFSVMSCREPLPRPSGMLDNFGNPIPETEETAANYVDEINAKILEETQAITKLLSSGVHNVLQSQPQVDDPCADIVSVNNEVVIDENV